MDSKRIPTAVEAEKSRMQVLADSVPGETPPGLQMEAFLLGPHVGKRSGILASFHEAINPIVSASASWLQPPNGLTPNTITLGI